MKILNFGSCCIDNVYAVPHFVQPGETLSSTDFNIYPGGKGLNQSIALARAGATVQHAGKVGSDGVWLKELLSETGVDNSRLQIGDGPSGHANIQVSATGENAIVIVGGTNRQITPDDFDDAFSGVQAGDFLLLQNEVSHLADIMHEGHKRGLRIVLNAAPMTPDVLTFPLEFLEFLIVNETEAAMLLDQAIGPDLDKKLADRFPGLKIVLTLGESGVSYRHGDETVRQPAFPVKALDTTGAGDTFTGYFLAAVMRGEEVQTCLEQASRAASIAVTRAGAATSIPDRSELV
ncbi:MAG: ribokinase [Candidatus Azotimanducaceae bacterium]|jgi:ribokinase